MISFAVVSSTEPNLRVPDNVRLPWQKKAYYPFACICQAPLILAYETEMPTPTISFRVNGPLKIPVLEGENGRCIDVAKVDPTFWKGYGSKHGIYIFSLLYYNKYRPYYVGKAADQSFQAEVFADHKLAKHYWPTLIKHKGAPYLFLVVPDKGKGPWPAAAISRLEERLIAVAAVANKDLSNKRLLPKDTERIVGIDSGGQGPSKAIAGFKGMMGLGL